MSDFEVAERIGESPWERMMLAADIGGVADILRGASALLVVEDLVCAPVEIELEISEAFDVIQLEVTRRVVRVGTDLSWVLA